MVALLKRNGIVKGHCQAQRVKTGANVGTGGRDRNLDLHGCTFPLFYNTQSSSGRRLSHSLTLPPTASTLRAASARAFSSACSTK